MRTPYNGVREEEPRECQSSGGPERDAKMFHLFASEQGGPCMIETMQAMRRDAEQQEKVITILGKVLDATVDRSRNPHDGAAQHSSLRVFQGSRRCPLKPSMFLARMLKYGHCSPCCLLVAMVYLQRINLRCSSTLIITSYNIQRLLLASVMLASKFLDDLFCSNQQWALIGDLQLGEMNELELHMLKLLDFSLSVSRETYNGSWASLVGLAQTVGPAEQHVPPAKEESVQPTRPITRATTRNADDSRVPNPSTVASIPTTDGKQGIKSEVTLAEVEQVTACPADPSSPSPAPAEICVQSPRPARSSRVALPKFSVESPGASPTRILCSVTARPARTNKHTLSPPRRTPSPIPASLQWERSAMLPSDVQELYRPRPYQTRLGTSPAPHLLTTHRPSVAGFSDATTSPYVRAVVH